MREKQIKTVSNGKLPRRGLKDNFNAFMVENSEFEGGDDIPICPSTMMRFPTKIITFEEARKEIKKDNPDFKATVCFSKDDYKFDSKKSGIWVRPYEWLKILTPFEAVVQPDFSTNSDFPKVLAKYNTYRMRTLGCFFVNNGIPVINNYRSNGVSSFDYCTDGIPENSLVFISTHGCIRDRCNRERLKQGLNYLILKKKPSAIVIYGRVPKEVSNILNMKKIPFKAYKTDLDRRLEEPHE